MGVIDYKNAALSELEKVAAADKESRNAAVWREALNKYSFASHQANYRLLLDWCGGSELSMVKIDWLATQKPEGLNLDWSDDRPRLIDAILAARRYPDVEKERKRLTLSFTRLQLIDQLALMVTKEELSKFTAVELKQGLAEHRKTTSNQRFFFGSNGSRWERLSGTIVPRGFVSAVSTSEFLRHIARHDVKAFEYYVRRYGSEQVNDFLNLRSA